MDGERVELERRPAGLHDAVLHSGRESFEMTVAGIEIAPRIADPDERPVQVRIGQPGNLEESSRHQGAG